MRIAIVLAGGLLLLPSAAPARAEQSPSFRVDEQVLNAGGRPLQGLVAASASFRMTIDAIGDAGPGTPLASASFGLSPGPVAPYPPPGEVRNLRFSDPGRFGWDRERSAGVYNVYRGTVGLLPGTYGSCSQSSLFATTAADAGAPLPSTAWFYLVTAKNLLSEEGTKGFASNGTEEVNPNPCP
jgi:hypothetical protein